MSKQTIPVLGFCSSGSGAGKTTLLTQLIPALALRGLRVSVVKHTHHSFDIDHPGKDSYRLRESGAIQVLLGSAKRWALMTETNLPDEPDREASLDELIAKLDPTMADLILVEGCRQQPIAKIEIHRPALAMPLLANTDHHVIAIATDGLVESNLPLLNLNDVEAVTQFVLAWLESLAKH